MNTSVQPPGPGSERPCAADAPAELRQPGNDGPRSGGGRREGREGRRAADAGSRPGKRAQAAWRARASAARAARQEPGGAPRPPWAGPGPGGAEAGSGCPRRGRGRARALRAGAGPGWSAGATGAPATKGCDPPLAPPSRLRPGQSERLLLAGGPSRPSCSEALAW